MLRERLNVPSSVYDKKPSHPRPVEAPDLPDEVRSASPRDCSVMVMSGATTRELQVAHQRVGDVRQLLKDTFNIGGTAVAIVNGREATEEQVLNPRDRLEFVKRAGSKGAYE